MSALMIALLVGLVAPPASTQQYPPPEPTCEVSDTSLDPGEQVTVSGKQWKPGDGHDHPQPEGTDLGSPTVGQKASSAPS